MILGKASPKLNSQLAEKIQKEIYNKMKAEDKIRITSQFFVLGKKLKESKSISNSESRRTFNRNK